MSNECLKNNEQVNLTYSTCDLSLDHKESAPADDEAIPLRDIPDLYFPHVETMDSTLQAASAASLIKVFRIGSQQYVMKGDLREMSRKFGLGELIQPPSPEQLQEKKQRANLTCLYRHFDGHGRLLYVGISKRPSARYKQHESQSHWFDDVVRIDIERFPSREAALAAELEAIRTEKPLRNIIGQVAA
jgi:hypothetical protein